MLFPTFLPFRMLSLTTMMFRILFLGHSIFLTNLGHHLNRLLHLFLLLPLLLLFLILLLHLRRNPLLTLHARIIVAHVMFQWEMLVLVLLVIDLVVKMLGEILVAIRTTSTAMSLLLKSMRVRMLMDIKQKLFSPSLLLLNIRLAYRTLIGTL